MKSDYFEKCPCGNELKEDYEKANGECEDCTDAEWEEYFAECDTRKEED